MPNRSPRRKDRTRERILRAALALFKRSGYQGAGIDAIMAEAGLTRGGFYAHFASKEALFAEVIRAFPPLLSDLLERGLAGAAAKGPAWAEWFVDSYLSPGHRNNIDGACAMPPLAADISRSGPEVRAAYRQNFDRLHAALSRHAPARGARLRERAMAAMALALGGVTIARALEDDALAEEFLAACRAAARQQLGFAEATRPPSPRKANPKRARG